MVRKVLLFAAVAVCTFGLYQMAYATTTCGCSGGTVTCDPGAPCCNGCGTASSQFRCCGKGQICNQKITNNGQNGTVTCTNP